MASKIQPEKKLRKKQVVINEIAKVLAELYAARNVVQQLDYKKCLLERELDKIINEEYK